MLVRPSRQAHGPLKREREDSDVKYGVFINEMNSYYRVGGTAWYPYKQTNGETGMWPVILLRIMSPKNQADMIEVGGVLLYARVNPPTRRRFHLTHTHSVTNTQRLSH